MRCFLQEFNEASTMIQQILVSQLATLLLSTLFQERSRFYLDD